MSAQPIEQEQAEAEVVDLGASGALPAVYVPPVPIMQGPPSESEFKALERQATVLAHSRLVKPALRGKPEDIILVLLYGRDLALPATQALAKIHVVEGVPSISAELMRALVLRAGHRFRVVEQSAKTVTVEGARRETPRERSRVTWTIDEARNAGLTGKDNWSKYPADMLLARATGRLCRAVFPDVLMGVSYTPEELEDGLFEEESGTEPQAPAPVDPDEVRADIFGAFEQPDPYGALGQVWVKYAPAQSARLGAVTVADENGEPVDAYTLFQRAGEAAKAGKRLEPKTAETEQPAAEPEQQPAPAPEQAPAEPEQPAPAAEPEDDVVDAELVEEPQPMGEAEQRAMLRAEFTAIAQTLGQPEQNLARRMLAAARVNTLEDLTLAQFGRGVAGMREMTVHMLRQQGHAAEAVAYEAAIAAAKGGALDPAVVFAGQAEPTLAKHIYNWPDDDSGLCQEEGCGLPEADAAHR